MKILILTSLLITSTFISCNKLVINQFDNYHDAINALIKLQVLDSSSIIVLELIKVVENPVEVTIPLNDSNQTVTLLNPPPISGSSQISKQFIRTLSLNKLIANSDIDFIFTQINKMNTLSLDPIKLNSKTISNKKLEEISEWNKFNNVYKTLKEDYKVDSYIKFSNPFITQDGKNLIFDVLKYSEIDCRSGIRYVVRKENNMWRITFAKQIWVR